MDKQIVESLVQEAKRDPAKFEPLYNHYYGQMMSFVTAKTGDQHLAEELVSNCFFKALDKIHGYQSGTKGFDSWLYTIAINEVRMHFRKSKKQFFGLDDHIIKEFIEQPEDTIDKETTTLLKQKLSKLETKELQLLELRFTEDLSFKKIGEILNTSPDNAKVKTYRLLKKIRSFFKSQTVQS